MPQVHYCPSRFVNSGCFASVLLDASWHLGARAKSWPQCIGSCGIRDF